MGSTMSDISFETESSSPEEVAQAEENAKVEAARAELYDEVAGDSGLILGKYQTTEDLANAYQSLQREYSRLKNGQAPVQTEEAEEAAEPEAAEEEEEDGAQPSQPRLDSATEARIVQAIHQQVGGEAEYERLTTWAAKALSAERTNAYNRVLTSGDEAATLNALKGLQYDYMMQNGYEPRLSGGRAPSNEVKGFTSRYQITQAVGDPRYHHDAAYRKEVERRIDASSPELF